jgi:aldose 1-epimerase
MKPECCIKNTYMQLHLLAAGAAMQELTLCNGLQPLLTLANAEDYISDPSYAGTIIAPVCGRIRSAAGNIHGKHLQLSRNDGKNQLHGGFHSTARSEWEQVDLKSDSAEFMILLPDSLDGFPGTRTIRVVYQLDGKNIVIGISAVSDKPTLFNPTTHAYWNFTPGKTVFEHELKIDAHYAYRNDSLFIPVSKFDVHGTAFDFTESVMLYENIKKPDPFRQLKYGHGYNNGFAAAQAVLCNHDISMTAESDAPDIWLYTGGFLTAPTKIRSTNCNTQMDAFPSCALALEPQDVSGGKITEPGKQFTRIIRFSFNF